MNWYFIYIKLALPIFTSLVFSLSPDRRNEIREFYRGIEVDELRSIDRKLEDPQLIFPCNNYKEMGIAVKPMVFKTIKRNVIVTWNRDTLVTLDGRSSFVVSVIIECLVLSGAKINFNFNVIILPNNTRNDNESELEYRPVYVHTKQHRCKVYALKIVRDIEILATTYIDHFQENLEFYQMYRDPDKILTVTNPPTSRLNWVQFNVKSKNIYFGNFTLLLDEELSVDLPAVLTFEVENRNNNKLDYWYFVLYHRSQPHWMRDPFIDGIFNFERDMYQVKNAGKYVDNKWAFAIESYLVNESSTALPPFL